MRSDFELLKDLAEIYANRCGRKDAPLHILRSAGVKIEDES